MNLTWSPGYGHIFPKTSGGQFTCIFFALVGIPLFAAWLMAVGERLQIPINKVKKLRPWIKNNRQRDAMIKSVVCIGSGEYCLLTPNTAR